MADLKWHKGEPFSDGTPHWVAERDGPIVAHATMSGRRGVDDYPWEWWIESGVPHMGRAAHVADTLRSAKDQVAYGLRNG